MEEDGPQPRDGLEAETLVEGKTREVSLDDGELYMLGPGFEGLAHQTRHASPGVSPAAVFGPGVDPLDQPAFLAANIRVADKDRLTVDFQQTGATDPAAHPVSESTGIGLERIRSVFLDEAGPCGENESFEIP